MKPPILLKLLPLLVLLLSQPALAGSGEVTLIHMGDLHGHLIPHANVREGGSGRAAGGLARLHARIQEIRAREPHSLLVNTGDTIQGSAEALFTRGQAMVDILNPFGIDAYVPGNWDYVYGSQRFRELFAGPAPKANWNAVAANLYYVSTDEDPYTFFPESAGKRVLPPYLIKQVGNLKVGILGFTSDRGPQTVGRMVSKGFVFTRGESELAQLIPILRQQERVDLLVVASELGLAQNVHLAETYPGIDVILSSDMHEETRKPVVTRGGTVIVEEGQDGTLLGELKVKVRNGRMAGWHWRMHDIDERVPEDPQVAARVKEVRKTFVAGPDFVQHINPINGTRLQRPIDTVVGYTQVPLHRANFTNAAMPAAIEGSSHDFLTDAFRAMAKADIGAMRGFRYGTQVAPGPIRMEDLYHFMPIGAQIGVVRIQGRFLKRQIENTANGVLDPDVGRWTGGWLFNYSGITMDFDPYKPQGFRASNIRVNGKPLDPEAIYSYAGYWYANDAELINGCDCPQIPGTFIRVVKDDSGEALDATEVVVRYLQTLPNKTADPQLRRIRLLNPLPKAAFGNTELQPLQGCRLP
ncbi:MAG: bifunctional metallophosphatase/5'-nucleotidase [Pseudomonadota bacterium]|uniref:bifunctional metallophosphatase/5'-nucleotidase n=1 Tax=Thermithiobacillus tepidarius TaxID=929 RepID=UPI001B7FA4AB|nr:bifunctional UDP-sugar hydrolase/5'-nucleotidase [Thermithiobacillus tepidarius]